jgi:hypothetical protein
VSILDTDHIWGVGGSADWVWKSLLRGHNPIFMDPYDGSVLGSPEDPRWAPIRRALGDARRLAQRLDLARLHPASELASTGYCLADPGHKYVVYLPDGGAATVALPEAGGEWTVEWFDPTRRRGTATENVSGGGRKEFTAPFAGPAVLHVSAK